MHSTHVIRKPVVTEKSTFAMNERNQYTFEVDRRATKTDIKRAVEELYDVKVEHVTTRIRKGKERRLRYGWVRDRAVKSATVRLREDDTIELF